MDIPTAKLALSMKILRNPLQSAQLRYFASSTRTNQIRKPKFSPTRYFDKNEPFSLTLIPVLDQERQLGFMIFDTDHLDLYGAIVQQVGCL